MFAVASVRRPNNLLYPAFFWLIKHVPSILQALSVLKKSENVVFFYSGMNIGAHFFLLLILG